MVSGTQVEFILKSAPLVNLVCGKHKQTVYFAKTYLWRRLFVCFSLPLTRINPALTMGPTAPPLPNPATVPIGIPHKTHEYAK